MQAQELEKGNTNLLKFLRLSRQRKNRIEKRCFPEQTVGVSPEAPAEFQLQNTLVSPLGYIYEQRPRQQPFSQRKFFTIDHNDKPTGFSLEMSRALNNDPLVFHRKKGLHSEYMDKNGWMSKVHKLMGFERSETSRAISNRDRTLRIKQLRKSPNSVEFQQTQVLQKPVDRSYFETIPALMGEKMRIRRNRNRFLSDVQQKDIQTSRDNSLKFAIDNFAKRELSVEMSRRVQTSRPSYEAITDRATTADFKLTNGFRSTMAETFRRREDDGLLENCEEQDSDVAEASEQDELRFYRTQKIIPRKRLSVLD